MTGKDYEVGYGKPPEHTRFRKGQSGNPKGRRKGAKGYETMLREAFAEPITLTVNGKPRAMTRGEAITNVLMAKALKGDIAALRVCVQLMQQAAGHEAEAQRVEVSKEQIVRRFRRAAGLEDFERKAAEAIEAGSMPGDPPD